MATVTGGFFVTRTQSNATIAGTTTLVTAPSDCLFVVLQMIKISNTAGQIDVAPGVASSSNFSVAATGAPITNGDFRKIVDGEWSHAPFANAAAAHDIYQPYIIYPGETVTGTTLGSSYWHYFVYRSFFGN